MIKELLKTVVAITVVLTVLESLLRIAYFIRNSTVEVVPLPYVIGHDYGPIPPWGEDLRILEPDDTLIWRNHPNVQRRYIDIFSPCNRQEDRTDILRQFIPSVPASLKDNPLWDISLNSDGFRNSEISLDKAPSVFRIVCLGDSWTFGVNVPLDRTYPQQLKKILERNLPNRQFEVLNLGILGYSSFQGLELLKDYAIRLDPDILIIGFGMNDASVAGYRDKDIPGMRQEKSVTKHTRSIIERIEIYKLLRYIALLVKYDPPDIGQQIQNVAKKERGAESPEEYLELEPWTRVSLPDYASNINQMIDIARSRDMDVFLLFNELWPESPYLDVLKKISTERGIPLINSSSLIAEAKRSIEDDMEEHLDLRPIDAGAVIDTGYVEVVFRVYAANNPIKDAMYIVGDDPQLGNLRPNTVTMYDDGTHGDQREADRVWSYTATYPPGRKIAYVYTNSGAAGKWEGLDIPEVRKFMLETEEKGMRIYRPIETFGKVYMQADAWHTNADGYRLIANALSEAILNDANLITHVPFQSSTNHSSKKVPLNKWILLTSYN